MMSDSYVSGGSYRDEVEFEDRLYSGFPNHDEDESHSDEGGEFNTAELEEMLYSQIYFEQNELANGDPHSSVFLTNTPQILVEEHHVSSTQSNHDCPVSSMLNFSARNFMCSQFDKHDSQTRTNEKNLKDVLRPGSEQVPDYDASVIEIDSSTDEFENENSSSVKLKMLDHVNSQSEIRHLKAADREGKLVVLSDSDFEVEKPTEIQKITKKRLKQRHEDDGVTAKKTKKNQEKAQVTSIPVLSLVSSSSGSDEDLVNLEDSGVVVENEDMIVNANGMRGSTHSFSEWTSRGDYTHMSQISLEDWNGDPPLSLSQVHQLLKPDSWTINDDDLYGQSSSRYYGTPRGIQCRNCNERGHVERRCPAPRKLPACLQCGYRGHTRRKCPETLCYNCSLPGHHSADCDKMRRSYRVTCNRCGCLGHIKNECPEIWRQYHLTTIPGRLHGITQQESNDAYCYNCGAHGHFGYDCTEEGMSGYWYPVPPCINVYDNLNRKHSEMNEEKRSRPSGEEQYQSWHQQDNTHNVLLANPQELSKKKERRRLKKQKKQEEKLTLRRQKKLEDKMRWKEKKKKSKLANKNSLKNLPRFQGYKPEALPGEQKPKAKKNKKRQKKQKEQDFHDDQISITVHKVKKANKPKTKASKSVPKTIFDSEVANFPRGGSEPQAGNVNTRGFNQTGHKKQKKTEKRNVKNARTGANAANAAFNRGFRMTLNNL